MIFFCGVLMKLWWCFGGVLVVYCVVFARDVVVLW